MDNLQNSAILTEQGYFVSDKMLRLHEIIQDFDPYLHLEWIPPDKRAAQDGPPYRLVHAPPASQAYVVMHLTELDANNPENILARLFAGDSWNKDVVKTMDAKNAAHKAFNLKEQQDAMEERHDMAHFLLSNRSKNWVNWRDPATGERMKLDERRKRV